MNWRSEIISMAFGAFTILNIFEDRAPIHWVGNLDTIFGTRYYVLMDLSYFFGSIALFLLYGRSRGILRLRPASALAFVAFMAALALLRLDDFIGLLNLAGTAWPTELPVAYWVFTVCLYLFVAPITFLAFGRSCAVVRETKEAVR